MGAAADRAVARPAAPERLAPRRLGRGFTLLEVMVALAILAAGMLAASQLTSAALRNHERAVRLEVATLLARGKLASLQDAYDKDGFRDFDQTDEGTFDREGHPEVSWKVEVIKPKVELGPDQILSLLTGGKGEGDGGYDLSQLLGAKSTSSSDAAAGIQSVFPGAANMVPLLRTQLAVVGEQMKKGLREVRLTVSWPDGKRTESFTVVTHIVAFAKGITP